MLYQLLSGHSNTGWTFVVVSTLLSIALLRIGIAVPSPTFDQALRGFKKKCNTRLQQSDGVRLLFIVWTALSGIVSIVLIGILLVDGGTDLFTVLLVALIFVLVGMFGIFWDEKADQQDAKL